ncbi:hypothetical protein PR048_030238 [Dryococelus australis]|uniref:Cuticle protein 6 n=1 Tax=Dryococelus australis TaxID=614101 RepID=A0ABQ9G8F5_9NEOP|nr:hypothetical protein PR048_030238 [Dryococelus australis]
MGVRQSIFASCLLALAAAEPGYLGGAHLAYNALPVAGALTSQYHAQDELGQYSYGYSGDTSAKHETRTLDGITQGGYSYLDANGLVQSASYVSDPVNGFRVAATNLPVGPSAPAPAVVAPAAIVAAPAAYAVHAAPVAVAGAPLPVADTPEVAAAKLAHYQAHAAAAHGHLLGRKRRSIGHLGVAGHGIVAAPAAAVYAGPARSFGYSTVAAHAAPAFASYAAAAPGAIATYAAAPAAAAVYAAPARSFGYSTVAAHAAPAVYAAAPAAISTYAAGGPAAVVAAPARSFAYSTVAAAPLATSGFAGPLAAHGYAASVAAPLAAAHVAAPIAVAGSNQYQAQDALGQYSYGYADGNSVKHESRAYDGSTHGAYSYVDGHGLVQSVKYHADALGFRAVGTNIPVAH